MHTADYLTLLNILVAFLGVLLVVFTFFEWRSLRALKKDFARLESRLRAENHIAMKAAHRVLASYAVTDVDARIALLESVVSECPYAFNGYNALGYAWLEKGESARAIDAFHRAIKLHPQDKAGYCDLAHAYLASGQEELALRYLQQAVSVDDTALRDIQQDARLKELATRL